MQLEQVARAILFGGRWEDKLLFDPAFEDEPRGSGLIELPRFPGRPEGLSQIGKAEFPKPSQLGSDSVRGQLLHFFANHELLAMELMALMLLKFPDAPRDFRAGIARTIYEEQNHLRLYVDRMRELGVDFGDLPVSDYFWNAIKGMASPLEFVTQMSLTLEQANLDFSLYYQREVARVGDEKTAAILDRVYREEIGHVRHGLTWFKRWTEGEDDWDAYLRLLPPPMTPRRAKGVLFSSEGRREAGFSERFIQELEVYSGSKGRPPVFWLYNPMCDEEIVRGKPGHTPSESVRRLGLDLEYLPMYLAGEQDVLLVQELPRTEWLKQMQSLGFTTPEFRRQGKSGEIPRETKIAGLEPWGWSPEPFERFKPWRDRLLSMEGANGGWCKDLLEKETFGDTGIGPLFSKAWSTRFLREWLVLHPEDEEVFGSIESVGSLFQDWDQARARMKQSFTDGKLLLAKAPWGTSGMQNKRILRESEIDSALGGWIRNTIELQGGVLLEPWLENEANLSIQIEVAEESIRLLGVRHFVNGPRLEYRGTHLDSKLGSLSAELLQFLHSGAAPLKRWSRFVTALGVSLREHGYRGPAGIDALIWREPSSGRLFLKPLVELNPRWTMGRVALELEEYVFPGVPASWIFRPANDAKLRSLAEKYPPKLEMSGGVPRLEEGVVFTNDPERSHHVLTALIMGSKALAEVRESGPSTAF